MWPQPLNSPALWGRGAGHEVIANVFNLNKCGQVEEEAVCDETDVILNLIREIRKMFLNIFFTESCILHAFYIFGVSCADDDVALLKRKRRRRKETAYCDVKRWQT